MMKYWQYAKAVRNSDKRQVSFDSLKNSRNGHGRKRKWNKEEWKQNNCSKSKFYTKRRLIIPKEWMENG